MGITIGYNSRTEKWAIESDGSEMFAVQRGGVGIFGVSPSQQSHVANALASHALNATIFEGSTVSLAMDAIGGKVNSILTVLETYGLLKTS